MKEIDLRWKDLESLRAAISHNESNLGWGQPEDITTGNDNSSDHGAGDTAEAEMAIAPEANDTPSGRDMANLTVSSPKGHDGGGEDASV